MNDQEPGTILTGIFTEKGFINKNVSLKKYSPKVMKNLKLSH